MNRKFGALTSSQNPEELANIVKGIILGLSGLVIFLGSQFFGIELKPEDVMELAGQLSVIAGAVWAIYGAGLALVAKFARQN